MRIVKFTNNGRDSFVNAEAGRSIAQVAFGWACYERQNGEDPNVFSGNKVGNFSDDDDAAAWLETGEPKPQQWKLVWK